MNALKCWWVIEKVGLTTKPPAAAVSGAHRIVRRVARAKRRAAAGSAVAAYQRRLVCTAAATTAAIPLVGAAAVGIGFQAGELFQQALGSGAFGTGNLPLHPLHLAEAFPSGGEQIAIPEPSSLVLLALALACWLLLAAVRKRRA